jgi:2-polyprenyl-3-methyl-5-hydroxy-6-metoxy-1,4-benzoquinol methylase
LSAFFVDVDALEPDIHELMEFERWINCDVLEVGCGMGTDARAVRRAGARYTGVDSVQRRSS